jgi:FtsH-binding integral membrane protein
MSDKTFKALVWIAIGLITMFVAQYIILRTPLTLMITIVWSIALVLYIHFKYSKVDSKKKDRHKEEDLPFPPDGWSKLRMDDEDP